MKLPEITKKRLKFIFIYFLGAIALVYLLQLFLQSQGFIEADVKKYTNIATLVVLVGYLVLRAYLTKRWLSS